MEITRNIAGRWAGPGWAGVDWGLGSGRWAVKKRCFYNDFRTPPIKKRVFTMFSAQHFPKTLFLQ